MSSLSLHDALPILMVKASNGVPAIIDWPTIVCVQAIGLPVASRPAANRSCHIGRYQPPCVSSSRVHTIFTGTLASFATCTASTTKSEAGLARRPNPPPSNVVWIFTFSGESPAAFAAFARSTVSNCVPVHISQLSSLRSTTQFNGSIMAWARYGTSYSAVIFLLADAIADCGSPTFLASDPGEADWAEKSESIFVVDRPELSPSSHWIFNLSRPTFAGQKRSAITATPVGTWNTALTPGTRWASVASKLLTFPPKTGDRAITAVIIPGTTTSRPNWAVPLVFGGVSNRRVGFPIRVKFFGSLRRMSAGIESLAAASTSEP